MTIEQLARSFNGSTFEKNCVNIKTQLSDMRRTPGTKKWANGEKYNNQAFITESVRKADGTYYQRVLETASGAETSTSKSDSYFTQLPIPKGNLTPQVSTTEVIQIQRDELVRNWVLQQANGKCELCKNPSPFNRADGLAYLEVHHVLQLADNGSDTPTNTVALCPNCHRELHYGENAKTLINRLYERVNRLVRE